ncbi:hypothetical protein BP5796_05301 [Coleophoma crateriformis]|uniref:CCHC-type domain-containing protein n=1 Tax=Coleophoma crateriformis TaxID=565419 RepID=A0A3D8S2S2_9HELO|nr:hypothetical protein BP5796_05301 [Coleophoma crateriformis]
MATTWSQGGQQRRASSQTGQKAQSAERLPVCFTCGEEGHFVVDCPKSRSNYSGQRPTTTHGHGARPNIAGTAASYQDAPSSAASGSHYPAAGGPVQAARYDAHSPHTSYGPHSSYSPPNQPPQQYQQYPAQQPYAQPSPSSHSPYTNYSQNQQYHGHGHPPGPSPTPYAVQQGDPQYGYQGYQGPQGYNQYGQPPPQASYAGAPYPPHQNQSYSQPPVHYSPPPNSYQGQNSNYAADYSYNHPQPPPPQSHQSPPNWNNTAPIAPPPYTALAYQQPPQGQYNAEYANQYEQGASQPNYPHHPPFQSYSQEDYGYPPQPQDGSYAYNNSQDQGPYGYPGAPDGDEYYNQQSRASSVASTPYASPRGSSSGLRDKPKPDSMTSHHSTARRMSGSTEAAVPVEVGELYKWEFKKIFYEEQHKPAVDILRPLSAAFDDDATSLFVRSSTDTISRYVSKNHQKEFAENVRSSHHWSKLQQDPVFRPLDLDLPAIPRYELDSLVKKQFILAVETESNVDETTFAPSRKRAWSNQQADVDNQGSNDTSSQHEKGSPQFKRRKSNSYAPISNSWEKLQGTLTGRPGTPPVARVGTPSFGTEDDGVWAPQADEEVTAADPTEERLARLGVSGAPKPVEPMEPVPLPQDFHQQGRIYPPQRQDSGYVSSKGSYTNGIEPEIAQAHGSIRNPRWQIPPPPPPPPPRSPSMHYRTDGVDDTLSPVDDMQGENGSQDTINVPAQNVSPLTPVSSETITQDPPQRRKIVRVISGKKAEPLRQEDDVTPKLKRNQPVVATAYE